MSSEINLWCLYKPYKMGFLVAFPVWQQQESTVATGLAKGSQPVSKVWSRIPKPLNPLSIWQRKHTHTQTPPQPQESPLSKYSNTAQASRLTPCSIPCLPTKVKWARYKHAVTASGPHCQAVFLTISSLSPLCVSTKCVNSSDSNL